MIKKILGALVLLLVLFSVVVSFQPADFKIERSLLMNASADKIFAIVNDYHQWEKWSPWASLDPQMTIKFEGSESGVGASHFWSGNNEVGEGRSTIIESVPNELIGMKLEMIKPMQAVNQVTFMFKTEKEQTLVTWSMKGTNGFLAKAFGMIVNCDKMVGDAFEKGLKQLKELVENKTD